MAAFDFKNYPQGQGFGSQRDAHSHPEHLHAGHAHSAAHMPLRPTPIVQEPILTMKIYDSCRSKECLTRSELGPARCLNGNPVNAPEGAHSVRMDDLYVDRIVVMKKEPSPFKKGYWDIELEYVFNYTLKFHSNFGELGASDEKHQEVRATSSYTSRLSLFGSDAADISLFTDLLGNSQTLHKGGEPNLMVEAKAIPLAAEISRRHHHHSAHEGEGEGRHHHHHHRVFVTIGLYSIIKLYRLVSLLVESRGFVIPPNCKTHTPNPCDFFDTLHFPMDSFSPPQKREFREGISLNIPPEVREHEDEHCNC